MSGFLEVTKAPPDKPIWQTTKEDWKVMNYFVRDLSEVRKVSEAVMSVDSEASINIKTSYDIKVPFTRSVNSSSFFSTIVLVALGRTIICSTSCSHSER